MRIKLIGLLIIACALAGTAHSALIKIDISPAASAALNSTNYENGDHTLGLSALNAVAQPASDATGNEIGSGIVFDDVSKMLTWNFGYGSDFGFVDLVGDFTVAHIHGPAAVQFPAPNSGAGVVLGLSHTAGSSANTGSFSGSAMLDNTQETQLLDNLLYINIHSSFAPSGEIRGQLVAVPAPSTVSIMLLSLLGLSLARRRTLG
jgi:hypothetical protein